jgi:hypothetical protein
MLMASTAGATTAGAKDSIHWNMSVNFQIEPPSSKANQRKPEKFRPATGG